jgi:hypothetical protein
MHVDHPQPRYRQERVGQDPPEGDNDAEVRRQIADRLVKRLVP